MKKVIIVLMLQFLVLSCGDEALLTDFTTDRITIVLKGTLESSSVVSSWTGTGLPSVYYLDLSEMRLGDESFQRDRQLKAIGVNDSEPFFNGTGIMVSARDVDPGSYYFYMQLFFRKMAFNGASYGSNFYFGSEYVEGYDFNINQIRRENEITGNIVFPHLVFLSGGITPDLTSDWVIEVRYVVKNNIKKYKNYLGTEFWAIADNVSNVVNETAAVFIGGNIASVAFAYKIGQTGTITHSTAATDYLVAVPSAESINLFSNGIIPPFISKGSVTDVLENIPVGVSVDVYTTSSTQEQIIAGTAVYNPVQLGVVISTPGDNITL